MPKKVLFAIYQAVFSNLLEIYPYNAALTIFKGDTMLKDALAFVDRV